MQSEVLLRKVYLRYTMDTTTIKVQNKTKSELDKIKSSKQESYDQVIKSLIEENKRKSRKKELIEGYSQIGKEDLQELKDWEAASGNEEWN